MHIHITRAEFQDKFISQLIKTRHELGFSQEHVNAELGVADRLVSKWESGCRSPTAFHLICWAEVLRGHLQIQAKEDLK